MVDQDPAEAGERRCLPADSESPFTVMFGEIMKMTKLFFTILALGVISVLAMADEKSDHPVHLFILSGQSNMAGMNPETGFMLRQKNSLKTKKSSTSKSQKVASQYADGSRSGKISQKRRDWISNTSKKSRKVKESSSISLFLISTRTCWRNTPIRLQSRFAGCRVNVMPVEERMRRTKKR